MSKDTADITTIANVRSSHARSDADDIVGRDNVLASKIAYGDIGEAGGIGAKRFKPEGVVV